MEPKKIITGFDSFRYDYTFDIATMDRAFRGIPVESLRRF